MPRIRLTALACGLLFAGGATAQARPGHLTAAPPWHRVPPAHRHTTPSHHAPSSHGWSPAVARSSPVSERSALSRRGRSASDPPAAGQLARTGLSVPAELVLATGALGLGLALRAGRRRPSA